MTLRNRYIFAAHDYSIRQPRHESKGEKGRVLRWLAKSRRNSIATVMFTGEWEIQVLGRSRLDDYMNDLGGSELSRRIFEGFYQQYELSSLI